MSWTGSERHRTEKGIGCASAKIHANASTPPFERDRKTTSSMSKTGKLVRYEVPAGVMIECRKGRSNPWTAHILRRPLVFATFNTPGRGSAFFIADGWCIRAPWKFIRRAI